MHLLTLPPAIPSDHSLNANWNWWAKNADGKWENERVIIINIDIPLLQYVKIYTVEPAYNQKNLSVRDARVNSSRWSLE